MSFAYDGAGRLTQATRVASPLVSIENNSVPIADAFPGSLESYEYSYDPAQNLLARSIIQAGIETAQDLPVDTSGRNRPGSIDSRPLTWDASGNLVEKDGRRFFYDFHNRLQKVTDAQGNVIAEYTYDAFNRRIRRSVGGDVIETVWNGWQPIEEYRNGQLLSRRTYGLGMDEILHIAKDLDGDGSLEKSLSRSTTAPAIS